MIFLILTIISSSMISIVMRFSEGRISGKISMLASNYLTCMLLSACYVGVDNLIAGGDKAGITFALGGINGIFYMLALVLTQQSLKKNGVVLSSVFAKTGSLLVPLFVAICAFGEIPKGTQIIGSVLAIIAIIVINYEGNKEHADASFLLILLFLIEGMASAMSKIFGELGSNRLSGNFLLYTFTAAFILSVCVAFYKRERLGKAEIFYGVLIGIPNFFASRFILKALEEIPAIIVYPTRGVGGIVLVLLAGVFLFGERLKKRQWWAIAVVVMAVGLLNI